MNILIVDDIPTDLKLLRAQLEAEGHAVFEAHDGVDALALLERQRVDVVISDILMPRMDGYRLCHEIRKHARLHDLPIILYTSSFTSLSDKKLALDVSADKYLKKPASVETIITALHEVIAKPHAAPRAEALGEVEVLKEYSERLVSKLEEKNIALEQANAKLRASEERFRQLAEHIDEVFWMTDVAKNAMIYISPAYEKIWSRTCESLYASPRNWLDAIHPEDRERIDQSALNNQPTGTYDEEYRIIRPDGTIRWIHGRAFPVRNQTGEVYRIAGVAQDITERKLAESQMLRTQRLESIGTLAGGVAHDLNNALAPILMATELLRLEFPDTAASYLELIQAGAKRGADMVKQLLTFAKGAEGERLLLQPRHLFKEMEKLIGSTFPKNIELRTSYAKDLWTILGDATQLHQVLLNLCVNARDAMPNGGTLTLKAENVEIDTVYADAITEAKPGHYVVWRVMDTGTGIPPEILDRIFEPFFSTKGPEKGTGLGLSTVIGIVKSHGGFVRVYSVPGQGTTFAIYLPAAGAGTGDTSLLTKVETTFRGNGETILVVDDEAAVRAVTRAVLTALNFKVLTASDGTAALIQVADKRAELRAVITDLHMPHMDGLAFVRVLKGRLPQTGIIIASGRLDEPEADEFKKLGVNAALEKPFTQEKLVEALKTIFQK
jgi:PAS domain S-box-containing protein